VSDNGTLKASIKAAASRASIVPRRRLPDYAIDGLLPQIAVSPANAEETAAVLSAAASCEAAVIPWGGGTAMATGGIPRRYDVALDVTRLNRVVEHVAEDLTVVVQAGARLQELQEHLAHRGQYLPLDPPLPERATIGGILASNAGGPWRHAHGWPRDWLLGMRVALPDGNVIKSGGRVVKNVAGYDMGKLFTGSFGTLGVIVEAAFKVMPLPPARATAVAFFKSSGVAVRAAMALHARNLRVESLDLLSADAANAVLVDHAKGNLWCLLAAIAGNRGAVERTLREMAAICTGEGAAMASLAPEQAETVWQRVRGLGLQTPDRDALTLRAFLLPSKVAPFLESAESTARARDLPLQIDARPALGAVYCRTAGGERVTVLVRELRELAGSLGGGLVVEACATSLKSQIDVWGDSRPDAGLMTRVKDALDARRTMSPGRFVGGL
jgi:glycolate oxidase FAD binding subunit